MSYYMWIDLALMAAAFTVLGLILHVKKPRKRGAVPMRRNNIRMMQKCRDYTVSGYGVAHRTASSYMRDVKVLSHLVRCARGES